MAGIGAIRITERRILVVEGREEEMFFGALMIHLGLDGIQILGIGGKNQLPRNLKALMLSPGFAHVASIGIARDADADAAFQSVHAALRSAGLPAPASPLVPTGSSPAVTVMILPGDGKPGALEDLCLRAVSGNSAAHCVDGYFDCLADAGLPTPRNMSKARIQVYLASRPEAGKRLGEAAQAGYWPWDNNAFDDVKRFLRLLAPPI